MHPKGKNHHFLDGVLDALRRVLDRRRRLHHRLSRRRGVLYGSTAWNGDDWPWPRAKGPGQGWGRREGYNAHATKCTRFKESSLEAATNDDTVSYRVPRRQL